MDDDFIDSYIELKMEEVHAPQLHPAPGRIRHVLQVLAATAGESGDHFRVWPRDQART